MLSDWLPMTLLDRCLVLVRCFARPPARPLARSFVCSRVRCAAVSHCIYVGSPKRVLASLKLEWNDPWERHGWFAGWLAACLPGCSISAKVEVSFSVESGKSGTCCLQSVSQEFLSMESLTGLRLPVPPANHLAYFLNGSESGYCSCYIRFDGTKTLSLTEGRRISRRGVSADDSWPD